MDKGKIFVFSAASGVGKTTILNILKKRVDNLVYSISATTREPREGEVDGVHYFFLSKEKFLSMVGNDEFAEWAEVHNNYYGTPRKFIDDAVASGKHVVMDIDVYGKVKFDENYSESIGIFILPPSIEILEQRLRGRGTDSEDVISVRLKNASEEIEFGRKRGKYEHFVVNDNLDTAVNEIVEILNKYIRN